MAQEQEPKDGSSAMEIEPSSDAKKSGTDAKEKDGRETKKDAKSKDEELSEEDQQLKSELEMLVERLQVVFCAYSTRRGHFMTAFGVRVRRRATRRCTVPLWRPFGT